MSILVFTVDWQQRQLITPENQATSQLVCRPSGVNKPPYSKNCLHRRSNNSFWRSEVETRPSEEQRIHLKSPATESLESTHSYAHDKFNANCWQHIFTREEWVSQLDTEVK